MDEKKALASTTTTFSPSASKHLQSGRVILASKSPRRKEIIENELNLSNVHIFPSGFAENLDKEEYSPIEYVLATAEQKVLDVYRAEVDSDIPPSVVIAADTIVLCQNQILEKPRGTDHHIKMLKQLRDSNIPHKAFTAVAVIVPYEEPVAPGYAIKTHIEITEVHFNSDTTDEQIIEYVNTGEGSDAAGGYKIQEKGKFLVSKIDGDYFNVVGLPVDGTIRLIEQTIELAKSVNSDDDDSENESE